MNIPPKVTFRMIRGTAPFLLTSVLVQIMLGILNKEGHGGKVTYALHGTYVPIVLLALVSLHATFGILSMVSRGKYRGNPAAQIAVIASMVIILVAHIMLSVVRVGTSKEV